MSLGAPATVLWHVTMSLDGFIAGPDHAMEWAFEHGTPGPVAEEIIESTGSILAGRRGYDLGTRLTGPRRIYGGRWKGRLFVLTHRPRAAEEGVTFVSDGLESAVEMARAAAGVKSVGIFGADVARQCLERGLLDEIVVHLVPVLLGEGVRFYDAPGVGKIELERTEVFAAAQITDLRFRVVR
jgi:dihydrofolate reductase